MARITPTNEAWKDCVRSDECSVNDCPLTKVRKFSSPYDYEMKCKSSKKSRLRIGLKWNLANLGLTGREISGFGVLWGLLSKEEIISKLKEENSKNG